jgi:hypothetical protein
VTTPSSAAPGPCGPSAADPPMRADADVPVRYGSQTYVVVVYPDGPRPLRYRTVVITDIRGRSVLGLGAWSANKWMTRVDGRVPNSVWGRAEQIVRLTEGSAV